MTYMSLLYTHDPLQHENPSPEIWYQLVASITEDVV